MKRVLHQEWLEKWLAGEDVYFKTGDGELNLFTNDKYTIGLFDNKVVKFSSKPKLLTINVDEFISFLNNHTYAGGVQTYKVAEHIRELLKEQGEV